MNSAYDHCRNPPRLSSKAQDSVSLDGPSESDIVALRSVGLSVTEFISMEREPRSFVTHRGRFANTSCYDIQYPWADEYCFVRSMVHDLV